ncbi:MarR family winged helix-turn-helix transcriptional regulator [Noviherbaspirillum cavernae]|nr:MarR family transcriptional regulator [Noviherbaspirillum cavernae]
MDTNTDNLNFSGRAPSANVQEEFGMTIGNVSRLWRDRVNQRLKPLGLNQSKGRALLYLSRVPDGVTQVDLARVLGIEAPTVTRLVKQLEDAGWLTRRTSPEDARRKMLHVTAKAKKIIVRIDEEIRQLRAATVGRLTNEQAAAGLAALQATQRYLSEL